MSESRHDPVVVTVTQSLSAGSLIESHFHDGHQIVYASRGILAVTTESGSWIAPANRAIWIPAGAPHQHRAYGPTYLHSVGFPGDSNPLPLATPAVLAVSPLLRELIVHYTGPDCGDGPERCHVLAVLVDQLRQTPQQPVHLPHPRDQRLRSACDLIEADLTVPLTLDELAAKCGASPRTLSRLFRTELTMSYPQWRTQLRLYHALLLLADKESVTSVAHRCGWASTSTFIDVFRRTLGYTPGNSSRNQ